MPQSATAKGQDVRTHKTAPEHGTDQGRPNGPAAPPRSPGALGRALGKAWLPYVAAFASLLAVWQTAALFLPDFLMPDVPDVFARLGKEIQRPAFHNALARSATRLATGYTAASALGIAVGLLAGAWKPFRAYARALISILQSIPPITWVPLLVILLGFGDQPIITVVAIASFFPMALSVMNAAEAVNAIHLQLAQVLGASPRQLVTKVYAPEVLPAVITGAQVSFGNAWRSLIAAEMVGGTSVGLGWSISYAGEVADMAGVLLGITVIGMLAALIDRVLLEQVKRRLLRWRYV